MANGMAMAFLILSPKNGCYVPIYSDSGTLMSLSGYLIPAIRNVQLELPDFQEHLGKGS